MSFNNQIVVNKITELVSEYPKFTIATPKMEHELHDLVESVSMELSSKMSIAYSRRNSLWDSFVESGRRPLVFTDTNAKCFMGVLSETNIILEGKHQDGYYTSDLRIAKGANKDIRKEFRDGYLGAISCFNEEDFVYTAIFKQNEKAIRSLTSRKNPVNYNKMFEYYSRSFLMVPGPTNSKYELFKSEDFGLQKVDFFVNEMTAQSKFSNLDREGIRYVLAKKGEIVASFVLTRSKHHSVLVKSDSLWVQFLLKVMPISDGINNTKKIPLLALSNLIINPKYREDDVISDLIKAVRKHKLVKPLELCSFSHQKDGGACFKKGVKKHFLVGCPQFTEVSVMFRVEKTEIDRTIKGDFYIDPTQI